MENTTYGDVQGVTRQSPFFLPHFDSNCPGKVLSSEIIPQGNRIAFSFENWQENIVCPWWCLCKVDANSCKYGCAPAKSGGFGASLEEANALHLL